MSEEQYPVVISGAGPAGAVVSLFLSHEKIPHLLLEKDVFPRDKICGDAISGKALDIIAKLFPEEVKNYGKELEHTMLTYGIQFVAPNGKEVDIAFPKPKGELPVGFLSRRIDFDNFVFGLTGGDTTTVWQNASLEDVSRTDDGLLLSINHNGEQKSVRTPLIVGADGSLSVVKRKLLGRDQDDMHFCGGIRAYYKNVGGLHHENYLELHFLKELLPGYFWIFPLPGGGANVGMGMLSKDIKKNKANLKEEMLKIIETHPRISPRFAKAELEGKITGWGLPLGSKKRKISGDNYILTGDAASLIDPFTGEGIGNAVVSALVASRVIKKAVEENNYSDAFLSQYDKVIYDKLWNELKLSHRIQRLTTKPWLFNFVVNRIKANVGLQNVFTNMFSDMDLRAKMKSPLFYVKLLLNK